MNNGNDEKGGGMIILRYRQCVVVNRVGKAYLFFPLKSEKKGKLSSIGNSTSIYVFPCVFDVSIFNTNILSNYYFRRHHYNILNTIDLGQNGSEYTPPQLRSRRA